LRDFKTSEEAYGQVGEKKLHEIGQVATNWLKAYPAWCQQDIDRPYEKTGLVDYELKMKLAKARNAGASLEEMLAISDEIVENQKSVETSLKNIQAQWDWMRTERERELRHNFVCFRWLRERKSKLAAIKSKFTRELKEINGLQSTESRQLLPPTAVLRVDCSTQTQVDRPDLNQAIAAELASFAAQTSAADCLFLRGYGDDLNIEGTRSEKSGSKDWNLLGLRGTEAIQVSSHRGPPTDSPPR
jgi:hypothetical protein